MRSTIQTETILIVLHQETSTPGRIGQILAARGYALDIRRPVLGDPLPETMDGHAGAIIFGGPMSANDDLDYIRREIDWINIPLKEQAPFLGICLGAQQMVRTLGGKVEPHRDGCAEVGYYPIYPTPEGRSLGPWPHMVYQWHREGFEVPRGARLLATGDMFRNQAIAVGPCAYGIQFHAELTLAMMHRWTVRGAERLAMPGAQARARHFEGRSVYDPEIRRWLENFLSLWLDSDARGRREAAE
ncbi:GMP synthase (glutamine-hydrolysing) [Tepidamorphus gemmatus]|jgi:GMP synthase (glutamine-hydrolysing)|uniref:GMP synthase (Glutamine-hydrolysing) n=1 Tax=Tepidamorphus gemmatus TaxID=747076 RepID=A0A4R3MCI5_9HYPH|nr:glutamine amidotransferase [Tepidamorphus gemmatus]TCT10563.1 GMP synthase (glutamine-hydrolysing) [Tepidamorphus gemmatus]